MSENKINTGYIYTINYKDDDKLIYVGSTTNIKRRWTEHKNKAKLSKFKHYLLYNVISIYGHDRFYIQVYETINFNVKDELLKREQEVIKQIGTLNNNKFEDSNKKIIIEESNKQIKINHEFKIKQQDENILKFINKYFIITTNEKNKIKSSILLDLYNELNEIKINSKELKKHLSNNNIKCKRYNDANYYLNLEPKNKQ